jgi:hypothetical protein
MIARAPHGNDPAYTINNGKVLDIMAEITRDTVAWTYVKGFVRARDGRGAYYSCYNHYLGPDNVDHQAAASEKALSTVTYNGEGRRWNFEKYVTVQKKHHQILEGLTDFGYAGIDDRTKVRYLLDGIKTNDLAAPKSTILSDQALRSDFDRCVTLFKSFIEQNSTSNPTRTIAQVTRAGSTGDVEDRYYSPEEYQKLTTEQKESLRAKREKRGHKPGSKSSRNPNQSGNANKRQKTTKSWTAAKRQLAVVQKKLDALTEKLDAKAKDVPETVSTDGSASQGSNRNNAALSRQH